MFSLMTKGLITTVNITKIATPINDKTSTPVIFPHNTDQNNSPTPSETKHPFHLSKIMDFETKIGAVHFFDVDQSSGFDADKDDNNKSIKNAFCIYGGSAYQWKQMPPPLSIRYNTMDGHRGIDFYVPEGTILYSPFDGSLEITSKNTVFIRTNSEIQFVFDHIEPDKNAGGNIKYGDVIGQVKSNFTNGHMTVNNKLFHEFHFGIMKRNMKSSHGWQSIDPLYGPCSTVETNPFGLTLFDQDGLPREFWELTEFLLTNKTNS